MCVGDQTSVYNKTNGAGEHYKRRRMRTLSQYPKSGNFVPVESEFRSVDKKPQKDMYSQILETPTTLLIDNTTRKAHALYKKLA